MKNLRNHLLFILSFGLSSFSHAASLCETYIQADENDLLQSVSVLDPAVDDVSSYELGLIQSAVLFGDPSSPLTPQEALDIFLDKPHGYNAGTIVYGSVAHGAKKFTAAKVIYYPGDNPYGAIFVIHSAYADLLGIIRDGDITCL
jgi:hypothetical protein